MKRSDVRLVSWESKGWGASMPPVPRNRAFIDGLVKGQAGG